MLLRTFQFFVFLFPLFSFGQFIDRENENYKAYYYENQKISSEGFLINGKPDGYWITYYPNELRKSEGNRVDFQLEGEWKFYDEQGNFINTISYKNGIRDGISTSYQNCYLLKIEEFENGIQVGIEKEYYPDSSNSLVKYEIPYELGRKNGVGYVYAQDGRILEIITYQSGFISKREKINRVDEDGLKQGIWKEYFPNGRLKSEKRYKDDALNGYVKIYNQDGKLENAELYINDLQQSEAENEADFEIVYTYYDNGEIESATTYNLARMKDGVTQFFDTLGEVLASEIYQDDYLIAKGIINKKGVRQGDWKNYYLDGNLKSEGQYRGGNKFGKWTYYYPSGQKEQEGFYDNAGLYTSVWNWYYENGNILRTEEFLRGKEDGMLVEFNIDSTVITKGEFIEGEREGEWYYTLNDHSENGKYLYGERNGYWKFKHPNGKIAFEGVFESGRPHGKHNYYNEKGILIREEAYSYGIKEGKWKWFDENGIEYFTILYKDDLEKKVNGAKFKVNSK